MAETRATGEWSTVRGHYLAWFAVLALLISPAPLFAQVDTARARADSARADSIRAANADTVDSYTVIVRGREDAQTYVRTFPRSGSTALLPPFARLVIPRDSIDYMNAETLGDVLATVPGVYLWRGGWVGRPEMPNYAGRGATSVEYVIDGIPWTPMGPDSLAVDPSQLPLGLLDRIEIEQYPGLLRVNLFYHQHDVLAPRTRIAVARGNFEQARYEGLIEKRWKSGIGFALGIEYRLNGGPNEAYGESQVSNAWLQTDWVPSEKFGVQLRWLRMSPDRTRVLTREEPIDTLVRPINGSRSDISLRAFFKSGAEHGIGRRLDAVFDNVSWSGDGGDQSRWQTGLIFSSRQRTSSLGLTALYGSRWTRLDTRAIAGWSPLSQVSASLEGVYQTYDEDRSAKWLTARAGASLPYGLRVSGAWRQGNVIDQPAIPGDSNQNLSDREAIAEWNPIRLVTARAGYMRLAAFRPTGYWYYAQLDSIAPSGPTQWLTVGGRIAPRQWFTVSGWYQKPVSSGPEGTPPGYSFVQAAIRSKFLRTFPSGIFDLKLAMTMESWGTGVLGRDSEGEPVTLKGATFFRGLIQMQFSGLILYWDRSNLLNSDLPYVPGLPVPRNISTYGVRWVFLN